MKFRFSYLLIVLMMIPSFSALADAVIADGGNIEMLSFAHDHNDDHSDEALGGLDDSDLGSTAAVDCHHCNHCHSLSFFYLSSYELPSFRVKFKNKYLRRDSSIASMILSPDLRPPIA